MLLGKYFVQVAPRRRYAHPLHCLLLLAAHLVPITLVFFVPLISSSFSSALDIPLWLSDLHQYAITSSARSIPA